MRKINSFFVALLILTGCASPYQPIGFGGGFSETQLSENIFQINFRGNGYTSSERAGDFAMLRSAELTLENGYKYFVLADNRDDVENSSYTTPLQAHTTGHANTYGTINSHGNYGSYSGSTYGNSTTYFTGGQTVNISKPRARNVIVMLNEKPKEGFVFDAKFLQKSLKKKYGLDKKSVPDEKKQNSDDSS